MNALIDLITDRNRRRLWRLLYVTIKEYCRHQAFLTLVLEETGAEGGVKTDVTARIVEDFNFTKYNPKNKQKYRTKKIYIFIEDEQIIK